MKFIRGIGNKGFAICKGFTIFSDCQTIPAAVDLFYTSTNKIWVVVKQTKSQTNNGPDVKQIHSALWKKKKHAYTSRTANFNKHKMKTIHFASPRHPAQKLRQIQNMSGNKANGSEVIVILSHFYYLEIIHIVYINILAIYEKHIHILSSLRLFLFSGLIKRRGS